MGPISFAGPPVCPEVRRIPVILSTKLETNRRLCFHNLAAVDESRHLLTDGEYAAIRWAMMTPQPPDWVEVWGIP